MVSLKETRFQFVGREEAVFNFQELGELSLRYAVCVTHVTCLCLQPHLLLSAKDQRRDHFCTPDGKKAGERVRAGIEQLDSA